MDGSKAMFEIFATARVIGHCRSRLSIPDAKRVHASVDAITADAAVKVLAGLAAAVADRTKRERSSKTKSKSSSLHVIRSIVDIFRHALLSGVSHPAENIPSIHRLVRSIAGFVLPNALLIQDLECTETPQDDKIAQNLGQAIDR